MDAFETRLYEEQHRAIRMQAAEALAQDERLAAKSEAHEALVELYGDNLTVVVDAKEQILRREKRSRVAKAIAAVTTKVTPLVTKTTGGQFVPGKPHLNSYQTTWKSRPLLVAELGDGVEKGWTVEMVYAQHAYRGGDSRDWEQTGSYRFRKIVANRHGVAGDVTLVEPVFEYTQHSDDFGNQYPGIVEAASGQAIEPGSDRWDSATRLLSLITERLK